MIETDEVLNEWFKRRFPHNEIGDSYYEELAEMRREKRMERRLYKQAFRVAMSAFGMVVHDVAT